MEYDTIIVGASFAGLAVASRLRGNILLIDRKEIGTGQTSACGTPLPVIQPLDCADSLLHGYHRGFIHTATKAIEYDLPYPFCAFDYFTFCQGLVKQEKADFLKARVIGLTDGHVITDKGEFEGRCVVDAPGWRTVLASPNDSSPLDYSAMCFGIETTVDCEAEGLHFWMDSRLIKMGVGWLFPCGARARIGVGSYLGETRLKASLASFLEKFGLLVGTIHGGYFPRRLKEPVSQQEFLVGDAAGQCEPLTGDGIGPALFFGSKCGEIVQRVTDKHISLREGLRWYAQLVRRYRRYYSFLEWFQWHLLSLPDLWQRRLLTLFSLRPICYFLLNWYQRHTALKRLTGWRLLCSVQSQSECTTGGDEYAKSLPKPFSTKRVG